MTKNTITLFDEDDRLIEMEVVATLKLDRKEYAILHDGARDEDVIFGVNTVDEQQQFYLVEDESECQAVVDAYYELVD